MLFNFLALASTPLSSVSSPSLVSQTISDKHKKIAALEKEMDEVVEKIQELFPELNELRESIKFNKRYDDDDTYFNCKCAKKLFMLEFWTYRFIIEHLRGEKDRLQSELAKFHAPWHKVLSDFAEKSGKELDDLVASGEYPDISKHKQIEQLERDIDSMVEQIQAIFPVFSKLREFVRYAKKYDWVPPYHDCECPKEVLIEDYQTAKRKMEALKGKKDELLSELAKFHARWN